MDRRNFVRSTLLSAPLLGGSLSSEDQAMKGKQQWYELRTYLFTQQGQRDKTIGWLRQTYLPALKQAGIADVGVFSEVEGQGVARVFLLIPFDKLETFTGLQGHLPLDAAEATAPAYDRIESSLLKAFAHMPQLELPEKKERIFELRYYESPSEAAGRKKIDMFNDLGEIAIFKKIGARPVFFGQTVIGQRMPNLIYMLCFDDMAGHDEKWKAFGSDPEWKKISALPDYSDAKLISKITHTFLSPLPFSQI